MIKTKREPKPEHMALIGMDPVNRPGQHVKCDYSSTAATWRHSASKFNLPDRDA